MVNLTSPLFIKVDPREMLLHRCYVWSAVTDRRLLQLFWVRYVNIKLDVTPFQHQTQHVFVSRVPGTCKIRRDGEPGDTDWKGWVLKSNHQTAHKWSFLLCGLRSQLVFPFRTPWGWIWWHPVLPLRHRWNPGGQQQWGYEQPALFNRRSSTACIPAPGKAEIRSECQWWPCCTHLGMFGGSPVTVCADTQQ